jgi:hypothetical protein
VERGARAHLQVTSHTHSPTTASDWLCEWACEREVHDVPCMHANHARCSGVTSVVCICIYIYAFIMCVCSSMWCVCSSMWCVCLLMLMCMCVCVCACDVSAKDLQQQAEHSYKALEEKCTAIWCDSWTQFAWVIRVIAWICAASLYITVLYWRVAVWYACVVTVWLLGRLWIIKNLLSHVVSGCYSILRTRMPIALICKRGDTLVY